MLKKFKIDCFKKKDSEGKTHIVNRDNEGYKTASLCGYRAFPEQLEYSQEFDITKHGNGCWTCYTIAKTLRLVPQEEDLVTAETIRELKEMEQKVKIAARENDGITIKTDQKDEQILNLKHRLNQALKSNEEKGKIIEEIGKDHKEITDKLHARIQELHTALELTREENLRMDDEISGYIDTLAVLKRSMKAINVMSEVIE